MLRLRYKKGSDFMRFIIEIVCIAASVFIPISGIIFKKLDYKLLIIASLLFCTIAIIADIHLIQHFITNMDTAALEDVNPVSSIPTSIFALCLFSNAALIISKIIRHYRPRLLNA
jgi:glucan phosphoethanolaminetransferase (alkaline phosphatase superfamily)